MTAPPHITALIASPLLLFLFLSSFPSFPIPPLFLSFRPLLPPSLPFSPTVPLSYSYFTSHLPLYLPLSFLIPLSIFLNHTHILLPFFDTSLSLSFSSSILLLLFSSLLAQRSTHLSEPPGGTPLVASNKKGKNKASRRSVATTQRN